jgi:hypothetical protein|nr:MAG TPA: hypothetical protein [Bacteriophage sp.]
MPSLQTARRVANAKNNGAKTIGQIYKEQSDWAMEQTWDNDEQSKLCYIYDWKHDDSPNMNIGMTYKNTTKTPVDAKILVSKYGSIDKDSPTLQCQFKPSQKEYFTEADELFYMEEYRQKYHLNDIFVGMYLDVPDKKKVYHRHLICMKDVEQNFQKYFILPCDYFLQWIQTKADKRYKRSMWCVLKSQSSYNSGIWVDNVTASQQNQELLFIPTNEISDTIYYVSEDNNNNQRLIVDIPNYSIENWTPNTWVVSKVERVNVRGRTKLTLYQKPFNSNTDYIEKDENGIITGLWANYFDGTAPTDPSTPTTPPSSITARISASTSTIKVGGSYKNLTVNLFNDSNEDITTEYADATFTWTCSIDNEDWTDKVTWRAGTEYNQKKVKFPNNNSVIGKILSVKCEIIKDNLPIESEILPLELTE